MCSLPPLPLAAGVSERRVSPWPQRSGDARHLRSCSDDGSDRCDQSDVELTRRASRASTASTVFPADSRSASEGSSSDGGAPLVGQVWLLAQDRAGSLQVQRALGAAAGSEAQEALARELHGHVAKAMRCPNANHVLQRVIAELRPGSLQFIVDELMAREGSLSSVAKHRYACRILQQLLHKCPASQTAQLVEELLKDACALACHTFGHFTIKQLLVEGTEDQRYRLIRTIETNMRTIGQSCLRGVVIYKALACAAEEDKVWIARAVLQDPAMFLALPKAKQGSAAVELVLESLAGREREHAREVLLSNTAALSRSKSGSAVVEHLRASGLA